MIKFIVFRDITNNNNDFAHEERAHAHAMLNESLNQGWVIVSQTDWPRFDSEVTFVLHKRTTDTESPNADKTRAQDDEVLGGVKG